MRGRSARYHDEAQDGAGAHGTHGPRGTAGQVVQALGLVGSCAVSSCGGAAPHRDPDGRHVLYVIEELGANVETSAIVGDSESDITAAINAGVKSVAVTFGYAHVPMDELGADALIDSFKDLPRALDQISGR